MKSINRLKNLHKTERLKKIINKFSQMNKFKSQTANYLETCQKTTKTVMNMIKKIKFDQLRNN